MPIGDLFGLLRQKKQTSPDKYLASSVNIVSTGEKGQLRPPFSQQRGINAFHSWVYAAATINANAVASVPLRLYKKADTKTRQKTRRVPLRTKAYLLGDAAGDQRPSMSVLRKVAEFGDEVEEVTGSDPILDLLSTANPFLNGFDLTVLRILYGELTGNSYLHPIIDDATDMPTELWPLAPNYVEVVPCEDDFIKGYVYGIDSQKKQTFDPDEVIHFKRPNPGNYFYGMGKVEAAFGAVLANDAVHQMDLSTFANSARPDYAVVVKGTPTGDQLDRFQQQVEERLKGTRKDGNFIAVSGDVQFTPLNFPPKDLAGREDIVEEIAAIFGVPVSMLKANDPNLASAKMGFSQWREGTILPLCRMDEQELNQSLLPLFGAEEEYFLAYDNPVPKDESFDLQQRQTAVAGGWRTPNEARQEEGREPIENDMADSLLVNGQPLGGAGAGGIMPPLGAGLSGPEAAPVEAERETPEQPDAEGTPAQDGTAAPAPQNPTANLNGAQIQSVIAILDGVAAGTIAQTAAVELIMATGVARESAQRMVAQQDDAKPEAQAEAEIDQAIAPMTEEQKSAVNLPIVADVTMALRSGYISKFEATKTLQAAGMTRKHAERLVRVESVKANVLRTDDDLYTSQDEAERIAKLIGCEGHHTHEVNGRVMFMPCSDMKDYTRGTGQEHESEDDVALVDAKAIEDIDLKPTETMANLAARGLELREEHGRGGTEVGVARARDIKNRDNLSPETVGRMVNFFSRHRVDLDAPAAKPDHKDYPSAGVIAWLLWGGDPADPDGGGHAWAKKKKEQIDREREGQKGGGVAGLVPKRWGTRLSANAMTALGRFILEKADNCGTGAGGFQDGNDCAEGHGRPTKEQMDAKQREQQASPEFKDFFKQSQVVDKDGNPLIVWHGTHAEIDESFAFEKERIGSATDEGFYGRGFYFVGYTDQSLGTGRGEANYYGPNTHGFYLSAQKVLDFETTNPLTSIDQGLDSLVGLRDTLEEVGLWKGIAGDPDDPSYGLDATIKEYQRSLEAIDENVEIRMHADRLDGKGNWSAAIKMPDDTLNGGREYSLTPTYNRADTDTRKNERVYYETKAEAVRALKKKVWNDIKNEYDDLLYSPTSLSDYLRTAYSSREITEKAEAAGYDGIRFGDEWIVFDPSQIKSATLNEGNFDPKDPRISKSADNCGTGAGGFQEGNDCAVGHGRPEAGTEKVRTGSVGDAEIQRYQEWKTNGNRDKEGKTPHQRFNQGEDWVDPESGVVYRYSPFSDGDTGAAQELLDFVEGEMPPSERLTFGPFEEDRQNNREVLADFAVNAEELSDEERGLIESYTGPGYKMMNQAMGQEGLAWTRKTSRAANRLEQVLDSVELPTDPQSMTTSELEQFVDSNPDFFDNIQDAAVRARVLIGNSVADIEDMFGVEPDYDAATEAEEAAAHAVYLRRDDIRSNPDQFKMALEYIGKNSRKSIELWRETHDRLVGDAIAKGEELSGLVGGKLRKDGKPVTVWRGVSVSGAGRKRVLDAINAGVKRLRFDQLTSTSMNGVFADRWAVGDHQMLMKIKTSRGLYVEPISSTKGEDEVILPAGMEFRVVSVDRINGPGLHVEGGEARVLVELEEIDE